MGPDENCLRYTRPRYYLENVQVGPDAADERTISEKYQSKIKEMMSKADQKALKLIKDAEEED